MANKERLTEIKDFIKSLITPELETSKITQYNEMLGKVDDAINEIIYDELNAEYEGEIYLISLDHDAGDYAKYGGDYIKVLDWLEETGRSYPIRIHSLNPVGVANMRAIIQRNGWKEIY